MIQQIFFYKKSQGGEALDLQNLFSTETIFLDLDGNTSEELFEEVSKKLKSLGYVTEQYVQGLKERENEFPTGLKMQNYGVAIPHTEPEFVNKEFVAVVRPKAKIEFVLMEDNDLKDEMDLCFFIGMKDGKNSPLILMNLITLIQDENLITSILKNENQNEILQLIRNSLKGE